MSLHQPVNQAVRRFLGNKSLPAARFAALNGAAERFSGAPPRANSRFGIALYWGGAAVVAAAVALAMWQYRVFEPFPKDVHQQVADEVATNHIKLKPLEVRSGNMSEVRGFFDPLDFKLIESSQFKNTSWRIMGGRFCTIRGRAAAQLRMQDLRGAIQTVYQVPYDRAAHRAVPDAMHGEPPVTLYSHGLEVRLWRERGLLFATVSQ